MTYERWANIFTLAGLAQAGECPVHPPNFTFDMESDSEGWLEGSGCGFDGPSPSPSASSTAQVTHSMQPLVSAASARRLEPQLGSPRLLSPSKLDHTSVLIGAQMCLDSNTDPQIPTILGDKVQPKKNNRVPHCFFFGLECHNATTKFAFAFVQQRSRNRQLHYRTNHRLRRRRRLLPNHQQTRPHPPQRHQRCCCCGFGCMHSTEYAYTIAVMKSLNEGTVDQLETMVSGWDWDPDTTVIAIDGLSQEEKFAAVWKLLFPGEEPFPPLFPQRFPQPFSPTFSPHFSPRD